MSGIVLKYAQVRLGTSAGMGPDGALTDISSKVRSVRLTRTYDLLDDTVMGMTAHSRIAGLEEWRAELSVLQDYVTVGGGGSGINKLFQTIYAAAAPVTIAIRPQSTSRSSDNPDWSGDVILETFNPIDGDVGALLLLPSTFRSAGNLTYYTSAT